METTTQNQKTTLTDTITELTLPKLSAGYMIARLDKADIKCDFIGTDEEENIIMKVSYFDWQKDKVKLILAEMILAEAGYNLLLTLGGEVLLKEYEKSLLKE